MMGGVSYSSTKLRWPGVPEITLFKPVIAKFKHWNDAIGSCGSNNSRVLRRIVGNVATFRHQKNCRPQNACI